MGLSLLLLLLLVTASCSGKSNLEDPSDNILALQWPENVCKVKGWTACECGYPYWTIHGWWPPKGGKGNEGNKDEFNDNKIKDLLNEMKTDWPDLANRKKFWSHEWNKHGKPAAQKLTVHEYFKKALDYYSALNNCTKKGPEVRHAQLMVLCCKVFVF
ncbi:ribonuclease T2-A-like [Leucoraja erinacea]|uniref:ribonuclease T2-A-like n=1 Tax=Leucoraja erinaceus TaxID=7782 RepID=UPI0024541C38|nr:ribonuclease T2-A-like [Leucoraja erinacea]